MTEAKRKAKILLLQRNETFDDVAKAAGLALATVHNVLEGKASSRKSQQAITNALGTEIWPGMLPNERAVVLEVGAKLPVTDDASAQQWLDEFPGRLERRGNVLVFTKRTALVVHKPNADDADTGGVPESLSSDDLDAKYGSANEAGPNEAR